MIARTWRGWTGARDVEPYVEYLRETGVKELRRTPGNRGSSCSLGSTATARNSR
jgi:hypothetical protein